MPAVRCPYCGHYDSRVVDSRPEEHAIRRRRTCSNCHARFTTYERVASRWVLVVKKDGRREEFLREKVLAGIRKACEKRPLPAGAAERLADEVETRVFALGVEEVPSSEIGELVTERLRELDQVAYIRFASVYRQFADVDEIRRALDDLERGPVPAARNQPTLIAQEDLERLTPTRKRLAIVPRRQGRKEGSGD